MLILPKIKVYGAHLKQEYWNFWRDFSFWYLVLNNAVWLLAYILLAFYVNEVDVEACETTAP